MECPSLLKYKDKWYLAFSDQWPDRVVHYRVSDSVKGPFQRLEKDTVDGNGFYAGRLETDGEKLYVVGWNGTKVGHQDENNYDWAGNAVIHQLEQNPDGSLKPVVNERVKEALSHELPLSPVAMTETVESLENGYQFSGKDYERLTFDDLVQLAGLLEDMGRPADLRLTRLIEEKRLWMRARGIEDL
jgi:beta-fructofuranosidase